MSATTITVMTPPGAAAIAVLSLAGPDAWPISRALFRGELPSETERGQVYLGQFGEPPGDEVVLTPVDDTIEIHCHGGHRVVRWLVQQCVARRAVETVTSTTGAAKLLPDALTVRTAAILLDQVNGGTGDASRFADVGRHLTRPWRVLVAGPPNAGKSSLINALAGYARSVVSAIPGTTRDVAAVAVALDGWPVELIDTAGVRDTTDVLETAGVAATLAAANAADLVIWLTAADETPADPPPQLSGALRVRNKCDLANAAAPAVSALSGAGLGELVDAIVRSLVPEIPPAGAAVELP